jgi:hypothetical protein
LDYKIVFGSGTRCHHNLFATLSLSFLICSSQLRIANTPCTTKGMHWLFGTVKIELDWRRATRLYFFIHKRILAICYNNRLASVPSPILICPQCPLKFSCPSTVYRILNFIHHYISCKRTFPYCCCWIHDIR